MTQAGITPNLIPLSRKHADRVKELTGFSPITLIRMAYDEPGLVRVRNQDSRTGRRYYLHVPTYLRMVEQMPAVQ